MILTFWWISTGPVLPLLTPLMDTLRAFLLLMTAPYLTSQMMRVRIEINDHDVLAEQLVLLAQEANELAGARVGGQDVSVGAVGDCQTAHYRACSSLLTYGQARSTEKAWAFGLD